jgi:predicted DNA binding CopG/RHH family protein
MNKTIKLTKEERDIEAAVTRGTYTSVSRLGIEKKKYQAAARHTFAKTKTVNIRISEKNLLKVKAAASRAGLSYQTFIATLLQKGI